MVALLGLFLRLLASLFKSKTQLEAENAALRQQLIVLQQGARPDPVHEQRSPVLHPAVSLVSVGPQGHHDYPTRDHCALASRRFSPLLALELSELWRPAANQRGITGFDQTDER
jgi:hypothetical protein